MCNLMMVMAHTRSALSGCYLDCFEQREAFCYSVSCPPAIPTISWGIQLWGLGRFTWSLHLPCMVGKDLLFQVWFHLMTQLTLNLWLALNLVILVWWLGIRLMILPAPDLCSGLLLIPTFILGSQVRYLHTFIWNQGVRIIPFKTKLLLTLNRAWIPPSLIPLRHGNWTHLWMNLMPLHHKSPLHFSTWLILFLVLLNCSLLLASGLVIMVPW